MAFCPGLRPHPPDLIARPSDDSSADHNCHHTRCTDHPSDYRNHSTSCHFTAHCDNSASYHNHSSDYLHHLTDCHNRFFHFSNCAHHDHDSAPCNLHLAATAGCPGPSSDFSASGGNCSFLWCDDFNRRASADCISDFGSA